MARFLTIGGSIKKNKRAKTVRHNFRIGPVSLCFVSLTILCLVSLFYLAQSNQIATKGYEISTLEKKLEETDESNRRLELRAAELQAVKSVEQSAQHLNMVPIEKMVYLSSGSTAMAMKKD